MTAFFRDRGLTLALTGLFLFSVGGMVWSGWLQAMDEARIHAEVTPTLLRYVFSGDFASALFENWESEFLQMGVYVILTALLFQRGSSESRDPDDPGREDDECDPGLRGWLYGHSLGLTLMALFAVTFVLHWAGSWRKSLHEAARNGQPGHGFWDHLFSADLWFESMQNWQSEFLSTAMLVVLSIYLRHRGSPESKPVQAPHAQTGQ